MSRYLLSNFGEMPCCHKNITYLATRLANSECEFPANTIIAAFGASVRLDMMKIISVNGTRMCVRLKKKCIYIQP